MQFHLKLQSVTFVRDEQKVIEQMPDENGLCEE